MKYKGYKGNLYGKVGDSYFPLHETTNDYDNLVKENERLKAELAKVKNNSRLENVSLSLSESEHEPYFDWCNVEGCENESTSGGSCWRETGYWTVCSKHSQEYRAGKPQPKMKKCAIDREKNRGADGMLVCEG